MTRRLAAVLMLLALGAAGQDDPPADAAGSLLLARWHAGAFGREAAGMLAVIDDGRGQVRAEVADGDAGLPKLLDRDGRGWTVILAVDGQALLMPWGDRWRNLEPRAHGLLAAVAGALAAEPPPPGERRTQRLAVADPAAPDLRRRLAARGRGRGGAGETLRLAWSERPGDPWLEIRSVRRPGSLELGPPEAVAVTYPVQEAFVPLWPLRDLVEFAGRIPGTPAPVRR